MKENSPIVSNIKKYWPAAGVGLLIALYSAVTSGLLIHLHRYFHTFYDLALFDQIMWNTVSGRLFQTSLESSPHYFGVHFSPILLIFYPIYAWRGDPISLMAARTVLISIGVVPIFLAAKSTFKSAPIALFFAAAFLASPLTLKVNIESAFSAEGLMIPFLLFALYFLREEKMGLFAAVCLLTCLIKEEAPLTVAFLGLYAAVIKRKRKVGISIFILSFIYFFTVVLWVIPHFAGGDSYSVRAAGGYEYLGIGVLQIIAGMIKSPLLVLTKMLTAEKWKYVFFLFFPSLFFPLLGYEILICLAPALFMNLISDNPTQYEIFSRYTAAIAAVVPIALIDGVQRALSRVKRGNTRAGFFLAAVFILILGCSAFTHLLFPVYIPHNSYHAEVSDGMLKLIPPNASVTATSNFLPHLTHRPVLNDLIQNKRTEYVLFETNPDQYISQWMENKPDMLDYIDLISGDPEYRVLESRDGIFLYKKLSKEEDAN
jgi:uncharacterized membrane protein